MSAPTPLKALLGGFGLAIPVHDFLILNGSTFGISGFLHRALQGSLEALCSAFGLFLGGITVGLLRSKPAEILIPNYATLVASGLLVGAGTKLSNGCTSGHMISGLSRFSPRSMVATASFVSSAIITTYLVHGNSLTLIADLPLDWTLDRLGKSLIILQIVPMVLSFILHSTSPEPVYEDKPNSSVKPIKFLRCIAAISTAFQFSLALRLSDLSSPSRVIRFLVTPFSAAFDPSLVFLALTAIPTAATLYHFHRGDEKPRLGGSWDVPTNQTIDFKLVFGAVLFGIGWGIEGICPGPAVVNWGTAIIQRDSSSSLLLAAWLTSVLVGGFGASTFSELLHL